jgi:hypothetical protein
MKKVLAITALIMLSACAGVQAEVKGKTQEVADDFARGALAAPCAMTYGAFTRLSAKDKLAVEVLCGGDFVNKILSLSAPTIAPEDLQ